MTMEQCKEDVKRWQKDSNTGGQFFSVDRLIDKIFSHFEVNEALHEERLKDAEFAITFLNENLRLNGELLKAKDKRIAELEEAMKPKTCEWYKEDEEDWRGQCGCIWGFNGENPIKAEAYFCPQCGGKIIEIESKDNA